MLIMNKKLLALFLILTVVALFITACGGTEATTYKLTFNSDGGTSVAALTVEEGKTASAPAAPTKEHYEFLGWYNGEEKYEFNAPVTENISLKARWELKKYTVTFDYDNGQSATSKTVTAFESVDAPRTPTKPNYIFAGWYDGEVEYDFINLVLGDITLKAKWEIEPEPPEILDTERFDKMQSVLLIGQSNMVGTGDIRTVAPVDDDRIFMMRGDKWVKMREPIFTNSGNVGIGIGGSFSKAFVETFDCELGLIPAAVGGTSLADWAVGGELYNEAVRLARLAQESSEICAILWHQGEADQNNKNYAAQLKVILDRLIIDLRLDPDKIVIVTGELFGTRSDAVHASQLAQLGRNYENYGIAQSDGLTVHDVTTHFDAPSLRVFGYRYFDIFYNSVTGKHYSFDDNPTSYLVERDLSDGIYTEVDFEDQPLGDAYSGGYGSGYLGVVAQGGRVTVEEDASSNQYMKIATAYDESTGKYVQSFVDAHDALPLASVVVFEAKFKISENFKSTATILYVLTTGSVGKFQNLRLQSNGELCLVTVGGSIGEAVGKLSANEWTSIKVIFDMKNNVKDIYINDTIVANDLPISNAATDEWDINRVRITQFSPSGPGLGSVLVDDYKCYLYDGDVSAED